MMATKRQKVDNIATYKEEVLFNSDTLSRIISYLPSVDVLNLALASKRFGVSNDDDSLIKESTSNVVKKLATEEQLAALPCYDGESSLADYHYLQLMREPLTFDQLVGKVDYLNTDDKSCVTNSGQAGDWGTSFSNNILRAGKHYIMFDISSSTSSFPLVAMGIMRSGKANQNASGFPFEKSFYQNFFRRLGHGECNNVHCCMYMEMNRSCYSSDWVNGASRPYTFETWDVSESMFSSGKIGMLLNLDEGTLSIYNNGRKLRVLKGGLEGEYCWVVSIHEGVQISIKRGTIPPS